MSPQSKRVAVAGLVLSGFTFVCGFGAGISAWMASDYLRAVGLVLPQPVVRDGRMEAHRMVGGGHRARCGLGVCRFVALAARR